MISEMLERWAAEKPDSDFIRIGQGSVTFSAMRDNVSGLAAGLIARGVKPGDRVAITCPTSQSTITAILATGVAGGIATPLNVFLKGESLDYQLRDCGASVIVTDKEGLALMAPIAPTLPNLQFVIDAEGDIPEAHVPGTQVPILKVGDVALQPNRAPLTLAVTALDPFAIIYTSGTTGFPKGCVISHAYALNWASCTIDYCGIHERDVMFTAAPLFHVSGMNPLLIALTLGIPIALEPSFSASNYLKRAKETGGTVAVTVGWIPQILLKRDPSPADRDHSLRVMNTIGISLDEQQALKSRFGIDAFTEQFGQTECWPVAYTPAPEHSITTTVGKPSPHIFVEIHDDAGRNLPDGELGEIVVRPRYPGVMFDHYWNDPKRTMEVFKGLWFHTGDLGKLVDGHLHYMDRKKDSMRRRGENVSSFELEQTISKFEGVKEVAVFGVKVPGEADESIKACLIVDKVDDFPLGPLVEFLNTKLPYFAVPQLVEFVEILPRNASGRVMKDKLRGDGLNDSTLVLADIGLGIDKAKRR